MFKSTRKARQFNYDPLFYDQKKEEKDRRQRLNNIDVDLDATSEEKYVPGSFIHKSRVKRMTISQEEVTIKNNATKIRLIIFIILLALLSYFLINFNGFEIMIESFKNQ